MTDKYRLEQKNQKLTRELSLVRELWQAGNTKSEISQRLGKSITWVTARLNHLKRDGRIQ